MEADLILRFEIEDGQVPNAEAVANALLAWINVIKSASDAIAPGQLLEVGLVGVEHGSDIFKFSLRKINTFCEEVKGGAEEFPLISKAALSLAGLVGGTVLATTINNAITPDPRIPNDQMAIFEKQTQLMEESVQLQKDQMRYYGILHGETAIKSVEIIRPYDRQIIYRIPRNEFAERSGLWDGNAEIKDSPKFETRTAVWDVILIKAVLVPEQRRWGFAKDGIEFSALMTDRNFLEAIHARSLRVDMAEGIRMKIEVKYREEYNGQFWIPVPSSHRVTRVIEPLPPMPPSPLFPNSSSPEK